MVLVSINVYPKVIRITVLLLKELVGIVIQMLIKVVLTT